VSIHTEPGAAKAWARIPVDDVGYLASAELLRLSDDGLRNIVNTCQANRYAGWRNHNGLWRKALHLDDTTDKHVLDYGCGLGVEALQYARNDNSVWVADIVRENVELAARVLSLYGYPAAGMTLMPETPIVYFPLPHMPANRLPEDVDVIHCAGVLHHIRDPLSTVERFAQILNGRGELRLMVYSDEGWRIATGTPPPMDVTDHPSRMSFVRYFDEVGDWADWYDEERLTDRFGAWFTIDEVTYLTPNRQYLAAILRMR
jgi:SAM-dependent methyltransferase